MAASSSAIMDRGGIAGMFQKAGQSAFDEEETHSSTDENQNNK